MREFFEFAPFAYDWAGMNPDVLTAVRTTFAAAVIDVTAASKDSAEAIDRLSTAMNPSDGFRPPRILGEGSTRRAWELPFGLVLKMERSDALSREEMAYRGSVRYLRWRRRTATFNEFVVALFFPRLVPRVYGVMFAFGLNPPNPAALIVERVDSLAGENTPTTFREQADTLNRFGVHRDSLFMCCETGKLLVNDPHFSPVLPVIKPGDQCLGRIRGVDEWIYAGNLGRSSDGSLYMLDMGNISRQDLHLDELTLLPTGAHMIYFRPPAGLLPLEETLHISRAIFAAYQQRLGL